MAVRITQQERPTLGWALVVTVDLPDNELVRVESVDAIGELTLNYAQALDALGLEVGEVEGIARPPLWRRLYRTWVRGMAFVAVGGLLILAVGLIGAACRAVWGAVL